VGYIAWNWGGALFFLNVWGGVLGKPVIKARAMIPKSELELFKKGDREVAEKKFVGGVLHER